MAKRPARRRSRRQRSDSIQQAPFRALRNRYPPFEIISADQVEAEVTRLERQIKAALPEITRVFIEAESSTRGRR